MLYLCSPLEKLLKMNGVVITATHRKEIGGSACALIRKEGNIPAVIYGGIDPQHISISEKDVKPVIYTPDFKLAEIKIDGQSHNCIVKDVQYHPTTDKILHIDFLKLSPGVPVKVEVPIRFSGTSPGVKLGGKLIQSMRKLKIKTTPENLVDEIRVDISNLELGSVLRVKNVESQGKYEILVSPATPMANIEIPRALKSAAAADAKAATGKKK
jgi:large subunit ribosomal protein L25